MKCAICGKEIEETFLEKMKGTVVRIRKNEDTKTYQVCCECQKEYKENIKKKITEMQ